MRAFSTSAIQLSVSSIFPAFSIPNGPNGATSSYARAQLPPLYHLRSRKRSSLSVMSMSSGQDRLHK